MTRAFTKMHGLGNDFVVVDARARPFPLDDRLAAAIADRKHGIGCDQLIILEPLKTGPMSACAFAMPMAAKWRLAAMLRAALPR